MPRALERPVDWQVIADAVAHYTARGYTPIETPWVVPIPYTRATMPSHAVPLTTPEGDLVGSGEQGLLFMAATGQLPPGRYQTTTPCFRSDVPDILHGRHFVKVELMDLGPNRGVLERDVILGDAMAFMSARLPIEVLPIWDEPGQIDIVAEKNAIELGSYGFRTACGVSWAYGTGVTEPRFSTVLSL